MPPTMRNKFKPLEFKMVFEVVLFSPGATFFRRQVHSVHRAQAAAQRVVDSLPKGWKVIPRWAIKASDGRFYFVNATPIGFQSDAAPTMAMDLEPDLDADDDADVDESGSQGTGDREPRDPAAEREAEERSYREAWDTVGRNSAEE